MFPFFPSLNGTNAIPKWIQRFVDAIGNVTFSSETPTPKRENDGSGIAVNPIAISVLETQYVEGASFDISFIAESSVASDLNFTIGLSNNGFDTADFIGSTSLTIPSGQNTVSTTITLVDNTDDEGNVGEFGDIETLLDWHRNDPPDDFEMNRNNIVYNWQFNRNPFLD